MKINSAFFIKKTVSNLRQMILIPAGILFSLLFVSGVRLSKQKNGHTEPVFEKRQGTAIVITGAGAKISQETALLEHLYEEGQLKDVVFISGASSGALNAVILNAILDGRYTFDQYKRELFSLGNYSVFRRNEKRLPFDTSPLRQLLTRVISDSIGYHRLSDLPYPSGISIVNPKIIQFSDRTYRLSNRRINPESDPGLDLIDVLMASSSYPFVFPASKIDHVVTIPDIPYLDGGIAADHVPWHAVIEFENYRGIGVEKMIIISRKRDTELKINSEMEALGIDRMKFFDEMSVSPEAISEEGFHKSLKVLEKNAPDLAARTYVYIPDFESDFLMFDFSKLKEQYLLTSSWAKEHTPVSLGNYLPFPKSKKF